MRINLIPEELRYSPAQDRRKLAYRGAAALMTILIVGSIGMIYHGLAARRDRVNALLASGKVLSPITAKAQALDAARERLRAVEAGRGFLIRSYSASAVLDELTQILPQEVSLLEISVSSEGTVHMRARGSSISSAARLLAQVGKSPTFIGPRLGTIYGDENGYQFDLTCSLRKENKQP